MEKMIVTYVQYERCRKKEYHIEENRGQGMISNRERWYRCQKKEEKKAAHPIERKAQQSSTQLGESEGTAKEGGSQRKVRRTFKILREVWLNIRVEKTNTHKGITVKVLLDSGVTRIFMDRRTTTKHGFKL